MAPACAPTRPASIANAVEVADKFKAVESLRSNPLYSAAVWLAALDEVALLAVCLIIISYFFDFYFLRALGLRTSSFLAPTMLLARHSLASKSCIVLINLLFHPTPFPMPTGAFPIFAKELWRVVRLRVFLIPFVFIFLFFSYLNLNFFSF